MSQKVREAKKQERENKQFGTGRMVFRNVSASTIILPKPSFDEPPKSQIDPGGIFTGDSYHQKAMESTGAIRLIAVQDDSDEVKAAAQVPEMVNVYDPKTGGQTRMTRKQFAELKNGPTGSVKKEVDLDAVQ
jgi:hypothetical protein